MTRMLAKVCGLTRAVDVEYAQNAGADLLGFVHYKQSPRHCHDLDELAPLAGDAGVLVIVGDDATHILQVLERTPLTRVQPYLPMSIREEAVRTLRTNGYEILLPWPDAPNNPSIEADLYIWETSRKQTGVHGGSGQAHAATYPPPGRFLLAGGMDAETLKARANAIDPRLPLRGFDAASRLEASPGIKDHDKLNEFVRKAHTYAV